MPTDLRLSVPQAPVARTAGLLLAFAAFSLVAPARPCDAQVFEATGQRALGMGGAFVAVADDATATYWNPAGLATGATIDACLAFGNQRVLAGGPDAAWPASETAATSFCLAMPALGFSYNRLRGSDVVEPVPPTATVPGGRQDLRPRVAGVSVLDTRQFGVTLVQSVWRGLSVGSTLKYVRGRAGTGELPADLGADALLDQAASLPGRVGHAFDADIGAMVNAGSFRAGLTIRNLLAPGFETEAGGVLPLHRQARVGVALTPGAEAAVHAAEDGWIVALDADLTRTPGASGDRRMIAAGVERWLAGRRLGLRGGVRANTIGPARLVGAGGVSVGVKRGVLLEAYAAGGGQDADRGWGAGVRVGF